MLLWIGFAVLTAAVVALLMAPLQREQTTPGRRGGGRSRRLSRSARRDRGRARARRRRRGRTRGRAHGNRAAADQARRRELLRVERDRQALKTPRRAQSVFYVIAGMIPVLTVAALSLRRARPISRHVPSRRSRGHPSSRPPSTDLIGRVEERLSEHPEDGKGWDVVAPVYLRLERYGDAAHAYAQANRLLGETREPACQALREATLLANNGVVTEDVRRRGGAHPRARAGPHGGAALARTRQGAGRQSLGCHRGLSGARQHRAARRALAQAGGGAHRAAQETSRGRA